MDDLRILAARAWDVAGRHPVERKDLVEVLYARLRWFRPSEAEELVSCLLQEGLFVEGPQPGTWVGAPSLDQVAVPLTYRPPPGFRPPRPSSAPSPPPLLLRILEAIRSSSPDEDVGKLREEANELSTSLGVLPEAAALLLAARRGLPLPELREELDRQLREGRGLGSP